MVELTDHTRCCKGSPIDIARHEYDRGMKELARVKRRGKEPTGRLVDFISKWERRLKEREMAAFNRAK